jgi:HK97 family phage major capsid protein
MKYTPEMLDNIAKDIVRKAQLKQNTPLRKSQGEARRDALNMTLSAAHQANSSDERIVEFQKKCDTLMILDLLLSQKKNYAGVKETKFYKESFLPFTMESEFSKAMVTTGVGSGNEWLPVEFSNRIIQRVQLELRVAALFERISMAAPTTELPLKTTFSKAYLATEATLPDVEGSMGTGKVELTTKEIVNWLPVSYTLEEDSIINMISEIEWDIVNACARAQENMVINGSFNAYGSTNDLTDTEGSAFAAYSQEFGFGGLRNYCVKYDNSTNPLRMDISDSTYTTNDVAISKLIASMKRYRGTNSNLALIGSVAGEGVLRTLKTAAGYPLLQPIYSAGPDATINKLAVNQIYGVPFIVSEFMRDDLNAYGFADHTNGGYGATKYTSLILVRRDGWTFGDRRKIMVETFRNIIYRKTDFVATQRLGFVPRYTKGDPFTVMGVKLAST